MLRYEKNRKGPRVLFLGLTIAIMASLIPVLLGGSASARGHHIWPADAYKGAGSHAKDYKSPEEAVKALVAALSAHDGKMLLAIFGNTSGNKQLVSSGDEVADKTNRERFVQAYQDKNQIVRVGGNKAVLEIGKDGWPFPIPIVRAGNVWHFSAKDGRREILNRRIGTNEIDTIQVCLAYVDAQSEYASKDRNGDGVLEYAQKFMSDPGKKNGLYWETKEGEQESPLGPLIGEAKKFGYKKKLGNAPTPYYGYLYKILKTQGRNAPRGAYGYVINGRMVGGFAMVAYPAVYGSSGIKTFIVSQDGVVYEKDLGKNTASRAQEMEKFDPDRSWSKVESKYEESPVAKVKD